MVEAMISEQSVIKDTMIWVNDVQQFVGINSRRGCEHYNLKHVGCKTETEGKVKLGLIGIKFSIQAYLRN